MPKPLSEAESMIQQPLTPEQPDLSPQLNEQGKIQATLKHVNEIEMCAENTRRLAIGNGSKRLHDDYRHCYLTVDGRWIIDLRNPQEQSDNIFEIDRVQQLMNEEIDQTLIRRTDPEPGYQWRGTVLNLEDEGIVVSGQTAENPYGHQVKYISDNETNNIQPQAEGFGLEGEERTATLLRRTPITVRTQQPEAPKHNEKGLLYVHSHAQGIAVFQNGEWQQAQVLPSSTVDVQISNNTSLQYSQAGFDGAVAKYDGKESVSIPGIEEHVERLVETALSLQIPIDNIAAFKQMATELIIETVKRNIAYVPAGQEAQLYIRPWIGGTKGGAGANPAKEYIFSVECFPYGLYLAGKEASIKCEGRLDIARPPRVGSKKQSGNYGPHTFSVKADAKTRIAAGSITDENPEGDKYTEVIYFGPRSDGQAGFEVQEASSSAVFFTKKKPNGNYKLISPATVHDDPKADAILPSITRKRIIEAAEQGFIPGIDEVEIRPIVATEIPEMDGFFTAGTAATVTRGGQIDIKKAPEDQDPIVCTFNNTEANSVIGNVYDFVAMSRMGELTGPAAVLNERCLKIKVAPKRLAK